MPASKKRAEDDWRISINLRPKRDMVAPVLFYRNHYMSNFHRRSFDFTLPACCQRNGLPTKWRVPTAESAIMICKATSMGDFESARKLQDEKLKPGLAKRIGRQISPWNQALWDEIRPVVAHSVVSQKFRADETLRQQLLSTGERSIAEAAPADRIWGLGVKRTATMAQDPARWPENRNLLGKTLENVRVELGGLPARKRRKVAESRVAHRQWGYFIKGAFQERDSRQMTAMRAYIQDMCAENSLQMGSLALRQVFGGRATAARVPPRAATDLIAAAVVLLREEGKEEDAAMAMNCGNYTLNRYKVGAKLPLHKDPPDYQPFILCVSLGGPRTMTFTSSLHREDVRLDDGDIYVLNEYAYKNWKHGMLLSTKHDACSLTVRMRK